MGLTFRLGQVPLAIFTDSSNNVGIGGAANASFKLQVTGATNLTSDLTVNGLTVGKGAASIVSNTVVGLSALPVNTTGTLNTAIGNLALLTNTTGYGNTSVGYGAIGYNATGFFNAAVGVNALLFNSTGTYNNALGTAALYANTTGSYNTAVGQQAGTANTTGSNNTYIGYSSGFNITTGSNNTIIGAYYGTAAMANNIVLADGAGNVRYQWDGTNNVFGNPLSGTSAVFSSTVQASAYRLTGMTAGSGALYWSSDRVTLANYNASGSVVIETGGGTIALTLASNQAAIFAGALSGTSATFNTNSTSNAGFFQINDSTTTLGNSFTTVHRNANDGNGRFSLSRWQVQNTSGLNQSAFIGAQAVTGASNYSPNLILGVSNGASSYTTYLTLASTGAATFSSSVTANSTISAYYGSITSGNTPATSGTTPVNPMLNLTNNRGIGMYFGGKYSGDYAQWIQVSDVGNLGVNYPLLLNPNGGNVGIGTSSPSQILDVRKATASGDTQFNFANSQNSSSGNLSITSSIYLGFYDDSNGLASVNKIVSGKSGDYTSAPTANSFLAFYTTAANSCTEKMRITSGGDVFVGFTGSAAGQRFRVQGASATGSDYAFVAANSTTASLFFIRNDGFILTGSAAASPYNLATTGRSAVIESNGALGYLVSTRESKANIKRIENIDFINQLNPVSFNYRKKDYNTNTFTDELYDNITYGFIADEVEQVNKELVMYNQDGSLGGVEYNSIIAILTKAVQELKAEIEILKNK